MTTSTTTFVTIRNMREQIATPAAYSEFCNEYREQLATRQAGTPAQYFVAYCLKVNIAKVVFTDMPNNGQRIDCSVRGVKGWAMPTYLR